MSERKRSRENIIRKELLVMIGIKEGDWTFKTSYDLYLNITFIICILISFVLSFQGTKSDLLNKVWSEYCIENHTVIQHGFQFVILPQCMRNTLKNVPVHPCHVSRSKQVSCGT